MFGDNVWVLIPLLAIFCAFVTRWMRIRHGTEGRPGRRSAGIIDDLKAEIAARDSAIAALEERIRVLERIVTDDAAKLSSEIERLRA
jgi:hypothetical protein